MARFLFWQRLPLTLKMLLVSLVTGTVVWAVMDLFLLRELEESANRQLRLYLDREAAANRLRFDRFLRTQMLAAEHIVSSNAFYDYVAKLPKQSPACAHPVFTADRPPWMPPNSLLRTIAPIDNIMIVAEDAGILECVQLTGPLPEEMADGGFLPFLSHSRNVLIKRGQDVFLFSKKEFSGRRPQPVAIILVSRVNNVFLRAYHSTPGDKTEVAIFSPESGRILASSDPARIPVATRSDTLAKNFLMTGKSFLDYGIATEPLALLTLLPQQNFANEIATLMAHERVEHAISAAMLLLSFSLLLYWLTRRITNLTAAVLQFRADHLDAGALGRRSGRRKGDELAVLAHNFKELTDDVLRKQQKLELETAARISLMEKNRALKEKQEQFVLLQQVTQTMGIGILRLENGSSIPCNPLMEEWSDKVDDSGMFMVDAGGDEKRECRIRGNELRIFHITRPEILSHLGVVLVRDITNDERMAQQLRKKQNLEAIGILAGGIAHDFNNLLTAILGNISLARMEQLDSTGTGQPAANLKKAESLCLSAREITSRFLTFSRGGSPVRAPHDIRQVVQAAVASGLAGARTTASFTFPPGLPELFVDSNQLHHVFANIAKNAAEAMENQGDITVGAVLTTLEKKNPVLLPPGRYIKISMQDHGPSIAEEIRDRIFDPYFTTKPMGASKAVGMGLAVAHSVTANHGGAITVAGASDGATVTVYLPLDHDV